MFSEEMSLQRFLMVEMDAPALIAGSTIMEPQMRTVWTQTALFVGMAEPDEVPERNTEVQKEHQPV